MDETFGVRADHRFGIIPRAVAFGRISVTAKAIYVVLAQHANADGLAWPSRKSIADRLDVSVSTIQRGMKELVDAGFVVVEKRVSKDGAQRSNIYRLGAMSYVPPENQGGHQRPGGEVTSDPGGRVMDDPGGGSPVTHRTIPIERNQIRKGPRRNYEDGLDLVKRYELSDQKEIET